MLLLTDGSIMCHEYRTPNWHKLVPDSNSDYANGTWHTLSPMPDNVPVSQNGPSNAPLYFASAVLRDGTVFCAGGEYNNGSKEIYFLAAEIYDPVIDVWKPIPTPAGWTNIGDASSCVLPDGRVLLGNDDNTPDNLTAIWDPESETWSAGGDSLDSNSEEGWTLLPDGTVLAVQCGSIPNAQKYIIATNQWVGAGSTPQPLAAGPPGDVPEMGPQILLPDGRVFAIGASGHTALYTPPVLPTDPGTWAAGPDFPKDSNGNLMAALDAPASLLPNGNVLCTVGPIVLSGSDAGLASPSEFFEFDPATSSLVPVPGTASAGSTETYNCRLLLLPTGQVMLSTCSSDLEIYTAAGGPQPGWRPEITHVPRHLHPGRVYRLYGRQLNGLSQACAYGDDQQMATNYPLVRLWGPPSAGAVYCRTFDHSTMGVSTGKVVHHTHFHVPNHLPHGEYRLVAIANGIASIPVEVHVSRRRHHDHDHDHDHDEEVVIVDDDDNEPKYKDKDAKEAKEKEVKEAKEKDAKEFKDKDCKEAEHKHCKEHKEIEHKSCKDKDYKEQKEKDWKDHKEKDCPEQAYCPPHEKHGDRDELLHRVDRLAERIERIEEEARRRPFIREDERPRVGEQALRTQEDEARRRAEEEHRRHDEMRRSEEEEERRRREEERRPRRTRR
ncbi:MAG: hypothetical protein JO157_01635 [Acetobacteraceae bacterium]|nr:hypothetical protein [Acetobacteraceae bacterium]